MAKADVTQATVIQIVESPAGHFCVHLGEDYSGDLTWDEMLAEVVRLTMAGQPDRGRYMRTPEQWDAWNARIAARRAERRGELPPAADPMRMREKVLDAAMLQRAIDQRRGDR
jgi:hypothetical protein